MFVLRTENIFIRTKGKTVFFGNVINPQAYKTPFESGKRKFHVFCQILLFQACENGLVAYK